MLGWEMSGFFSQKIFSGNVCWKILKNSPAISGILKYFKIFALLKSFEVMMGADAPIPPVVMNGRRSRRLIPSENFVLLISQVLRLSRFSRQSSLMRRLSPRRNAPRRHQLPVQEFACGPLPKRDPTRTWRRISEVKLGKTFVFDCVAPTRRISGEWGALPWITF